MGIETEEFSVWKVPGCFSHGSDKKRSNLLDMVVFSLHFLTWISVFHIPYRQIFYLSLTPLLHFMFIPYEELIQFSFRTL